MHVDREGLGTDKASAFCAAFCPWAEEWLLQWITIRSWKKACRLRLGAIIKEEDVVLTNKTKPGIGCCKTFLLQQEHQGALSSDVMMCWSA